MALTDPDTDLFTGGLQTVANDKSSAEYLRMLAVYGAAQFTGTPATAEGHIEDDLNTTFGAIKFHQFNGLNHGMKRIYSLVARYGLIRSITLQAAAAFPHADLADDFAVVPLAQLKLQHEGGVRAFEFFVEMQNQVQSYGKTAANIRTYLKGLDLPSTATEVLYASGDRARLAVALVRSYQSDNWNGVNDPSADGFRVTAGNIAINRHSEQYMAEIEIRSWLAEAEGISKPFAAALQVLNQDSTGSDIAWDELINVYDRNVGRVTLESNLWQAWMLGHGYAPELVMTDLQNGIGDYSTYTKRIQVAADTLHAVPAKFVVQLVTDADLQIDKVDLVISGFDPEYDGSAITATDGDLTVNTATLVGDDMTLEMTGGPLAAGTHTLCTIALDDAPDNATLMDKALSIAITEVSEAGNLLTDQFTAVPFRYRIAVKDAQIEQKLPTFRDDGIRR